MRLPNLFGIGPQIVLMASVPILVTALVLWGVIDRVAQGIIYQHEYLDIDDDSHLRGWEVRASTFSLRSEVITLATSAADERRIGALLRGVVTANNTPDYSYRWAAYFGPDGRARRAARWCPGEGEEGRAEDVVDPSALHGLDGLGEVRAAAGLARQQAELSDVGPGVWQAEGREFRVAAPVYRGDAKAPEGVVCVAMDFDRLEQWVGRAPRHLTFLYDETGRPVIYPSDIMTAKQAAGLLQKSGPFEALFSQFPSVAPGPPAPGARQRQQWEFQNRWEQLHVRPWPDEIGIHVLRIGVEDAVVQPETRRQLQDWLIAMQKSHGRKLRVNRIVNKDDKFVYARSGDRALLNEVRQALRQHPALGGLTRTWAPIQCRDYSLRYQKLNYDPVKMERFWVLVTGASREEILDDYWTERRPFLWGVTALLGATLGLTGLATHVVTGRLRQIRTAAEGLMAGRHDVTLPTRARDETGVLACAFEAMIGQVRARTEALEEGAARTQAILDMAAEGIITIDQRGHIEIFNRAAERILGYPAAEVLGRHVGVLLPEATDATRPGTLGHLLERVRKDRDAVLNHACELIGRRKDGSSFPLEVAVGEVDLGGRRLFTAIVRDITERKQMERERERRKDELEQAVRQRTAELERAKAALEHSNQELSGARDATEAAMRTQVKFFDEVAHDLRTPLTVVIGFSESLLRKATRLGQTAFIPDLKLIVNKGNELTEMINDLLNVHKAMSGKELELNIAEFDVPRMLRKRLEGIDYLAQQYGNTLELDCAADLGTMVADEARVWRILMNLLSNACKFTQDGTVRLVARREPGPGGDQILFQVSDTGMGMEEDQIKRLFDRFSQVHARGAARGEGFGLGLSTCALYCRVMGGEIRPVESAPGRGSTFTVRLPAGRGGDPAAPPAPRARKAAGDAANVVLIIDDDASVCELMRRNLAEEGFEPRTAGSGEEGLRLAKQLLPSAIILDVILPGIDGWAVLAALKTDAQTADIPIIMATMLDDRQRGLALGADEYLTKPLSSDRLSELIHKHLGGRPSARILVVEDDPDMRRNLCRSLEEQGWQVAQAADGYQALERLAEALPELILLDLMLPRMDGFEVIEQIRKNADWRDIPVIVVTGIDLDPASRRHLQGQVEQILCKGLFGRDELFREIRTLIAEAGARAAPEAVEEIDA